MSLSPFEPLENLPPGRKRITTALLAKGWERADIEELLSGVECDLADAIREERDDMDAATLFSQAFHDGMSYAANYIDPHGGKAQRPGIDPPA